MTDLTDPDTLNLIARELAARGVQGVFPDAMSAASTEIRRLRHEAGLALVRINTIAYTLGLPESETIELAAERIHGELSRRAHPLPVCSDIGP